MIQKFPGQKEQTFAHDKIIKITTARDRRKNTSFTVRKKRRVTDGEKLKSRCEIQKKKKKTVENTVQNIRTSDPGSGLVAREYPRALVGTGGYVVVNTRSFIVNKKKMNKNKEQPR